jgi:hypothetical protein
MPPPAGRPVIDAAALLPAGARGPAPPAAQPHNDTLGRGTAVLEVVGMGHQGSLRPERLTRLVGMPPEPQVSGLVAFQAADDEVCHESGVLDDGVGVEGVGGVEVAGEGHEREGRGAAVGDQEMEGGQRDGSDPALVREVVEQALDGGERGLDVGVVDIGGPAVAGGWGACPGVRSLWTGEPSSRPAAT